MKTKIFLILICICISANSCLQAQNANNINDVEKMIKNFYTEHFNILINTPVSIPLNVLNKKLDSLAQIYCTKELRNKTREWSEEGHDLMTNDFGSVALNEDLKVVKDLTKENDYIVTFVATNSDASGKQIKQKVLLRVSVVKEEGSYKISDVK